MNLSFIAPLSVALSCCTSLPLAVGSAPTINDLRSAYLQRAHGELQPLDRRAPDTIRADLQRHFDSVLLILDENAEESVLKALTRLEHRQGIEWSPQQRSYWRQFLIKRRDENIQRLVSYRDQGLFPQNDGYSQRAVPIFVDRHDTACAVGHLMRESGWEREVEFIETTNLFVYVNNVRDGPLVSWVLQSGLTQEEAALIQPAYPFELTQDLVELEAGNSTISTTGLVFNEFSSNAMSSLALDVGKGYREFAPDYLSAIYPKGSHWLSVGGQLVDQNGNYIGRRFISDATDETLELSFRVNTVGASSRINQIALRTNHYNYGFQAEGPGLNSGFFDPADYPYSQVDFGITARITDLKTSQQYELVLNPGTAQFEQLPETYGFPANGIVQMSLPESNDLLMEITARFPDLSYYDIPPLPEFGLPNGIDYGRITLGNFSVYLNVIPEPSALATLTIGIFAMVHVRCLSLSGRN